MKIRRNPVAPLGDWYWGGCYDLDVIIFILLSVIFASLEPFLPGSVLLGWVVAVGAMRRDWRGLVTVLIAGVLRDVVMVSRLGVSSLLFVMVWVAAAFVSSRFEHPVVTVSAVTVGSTFIMGRVFASGTPMGDVAVTVVFGVLSVTIWRSLRERRSGIRLRGS